MSQVKREKALSVGMEVAEQFGRVNEFHAQVIRHLPNPNKNAMQYWIESPLEMRQALAHFRAQPFGENQKAIFGREWARVYKSFFGMHIPDLWEDSELFEPRCLYKIRFPFWPVGPDAVSGMYVQKGLTLDRIVAVFDNMQSSNFYLNRQFWADLEHNRNTRKAYFMLYWPHRIYWPSDDPRVRENNPPEPEDGLTLMEGLLHVLHALANGIKIPETNSRIVCGGSIHKTGKIPVIDVSNQLMIVELVNWHKDHFRGQHEIVNFEISL